MFESEAAGPTRPCITCVLVWCVYVRTCGVEELASRRRRLGRSLHHSLRRSHWVVAAVDPWSGAASGYGAAPSPRPRLQRRHTAAAAAAAAAAVAAAAACEETGKGSN